MPPSLTSSFQDIHNHVDCRQQYFHLASGGPSTRTVIFTIIIILFTVLIEVFANYNFGAVDAKNNGGARDVESVSGSAPSTPQPQPQPLPQAQPQPQPQPQPQFDIEDEDDDEIENDAPPTATTAIIASKTAPGFTSCCIPDPPPAVRANRLAAAILLYIPIVIAFHLRISEIEYPKVRYVCIQYLADTMYPNWWAITFLNIIPFISATFALLRTLVDCWLVRYGKSLGYGDMSKCMWVPCMPAGIVFGAVLMVWFVVKLLVSCCMGRPELALGERGKAGKKKKNDVEMQQSEEARRLVDNVDGEGNSLHGDDDDDGDGPPAYETVYDAEASVPAKGE